MFIVALPLMRRRVVLGAKIVKLRGFVTAGLLALTAVAPANAQAGRPNTLFACSVGKKNVSVTAVGTDLIYRFGAADKVEMSIVGGPESGTVYWMAQRYAGMEYQLRFKNGDYSYIVYSMEGNGNTGVSPVSGLVVMQGAKRLADLSCTKHAEFGVSYDFDKLPEDTEAYSAM